MIRAILAMLAVLLLCGFADGVNADTISIGWGALGMAVCLAVIFILSRGGKKNVDVEENA